MPKFQMVFSQAEGTVLNTIWEKPNDDHTTHGLMQILNQNVRMNSPEEQKAFTATEEAVERLYELGLLQGTRLKDNAGRIYFSGLKLTRKGEQETIRYRKDQVRAKQALDEAVESSRETVEIINRASRK